MTDINKIEREGKAMAHLLCAALGEPEEGVQRVVREIAKILYTRTDLAGVVEFGNFIKDDPTMVHAAGWTLRKGKEEKAQDCAWLFDCIQEFWDADREGKVQPRPGQDQLHGRAEDHDAALVGSCPCRAGLAARGRGGLEEGLQRGLVSTHRGPRVGLLEWGLAPCLRRLK
jgi:hypothetical protein